jgi:hypothetical protein
LRIVLTAGQVHEATQASVLIAGFTLVSVIADKGFDTNSFREELAAAEVDAVIPPITRRTAEIAYDANAYGLRYLIECFINKSSIIAESPLVMKRPRETFCRCAIFSKCQQALV